MFWGIQRIEDAVLSAAENVHPAMILLQKPIHVVDQVLGRSIDFVEQKMPSIYLPPEMVGIYKCIGNIFAKLQT